MKHFSHIGRVWTVTVTALVLASGMGSAQSQKGNQDNRTTLKPDAPGLAHNHRLILKDGSYQVVRQYQVVGDRVRYMSLERGGIGKSCLTIWWTGMRLGNGSRATAVRTRARKELRPP